MQHFPGEIKQTAFNPFIPLNDKDSSIPGAFFEIELYNNKDIKIDYTILLSVKNPFEKKTVNQYGSDDGIKQIEMYSDEFSAKMKELSVL